MNDENETETNAELNHNFQCSLSDRLTKYKKQIDNLFDSLHSKIKHSDNLLSPDGDGDYKLDEFSETKREEFVKKVIRYEFRNDITRLISYKCSTDMDNHQRNLTSESFNKIVQFFEQLKLTDSSVIDHQKYSGVIDVLDSLKIFNRDSNANVIQLLKKLTLCSISNCNDVGNDESIVNNTIEVVKDVEMILVNFPDDDSIIESETKENCHAMLGNSLIEQACMCDNGFVSKKYVYIEKDEDMIEVVKSIEIVVLNFSDKCNSNSESEIKEKFNPILGNLSAVQQKFVSDIEDNDLIEVVKDIKALLLNPSDEKYSNNKLEIEKKFYPVFSNSQFEQKFISDNELVSEKSFSSCESKITLVEREAFISSIENLNFSTIVSPKPIVNNQKNAAVEFTDFIVDRRLVTIGSRFTERELKSMYDTYEATVNPEISIADQLLPVLQFNDIVKKNVTLSDQNKSYVEFKEILFHNENDYLKIHPSELVPFKGEVIKTLNTSYFGRFRTFYCSICKDCFHTKEKFDDHIILEMHILKTIHLRNRSWFIKCVDYLQIAGIPDHELDFGETKTYEISFTNVSQDVNKIYIWKIFELFNLENDMKIEYGSNFCLEKGNSFKIQMKVKFTNILTSEKLCPIVLKVSQNDFSEYNFILIEPHFKVVKASEKVNCAMENLKKYNPSLKTQYSNSNTRYSIVKSMETSRFIDSGAFEAFHPNQEKTRKNVAIAKCRIQKNLPKLDPPKHDKRSLENGKNEEKVVTPHAPRISRAKKIPKLRLPENLIPPILETLLKSQFKTTNFQFSSRDKEEFENIMKLLFEEGTLKMLHNKDVLTKHNYIDRLHYEMWIEEYQLLKDLRSFSQRDVDLLTDKLPESLIGISTPDLSEGRPSLVKGDIIIIKSKSTTFLYGFLICEGSIQVIEEKAVYVKLHRTFYTKKCWRYKADVEFKLNRYSLKMSHTVLERLRGFKWQECLFPTTFNKNSNNMQLNSFFNKSVARNELQVQAVTNIVQNTAFPAPYILFGPPGTGKTSTLVEAIAQIWSTMKFNRICVCASSNSAADVIAKRLLQYIPLSDIIRIYSLSRNDADIISELQDCSNYDPEIKEVFFPSFAELKSKRIVVMTPVTVGRFILNGITFDHVFIDEAGHTLEVEVLIPLSGFLHSNRCSMILAGDPKQLGPVVRSYYAKALGYGMSLLERLMTQNEIYKKDPLTGKYNPKLITKLVKNYRSHNKILDICSVQFYDNELEATAPEPLISSLCLWDELPAKGFPIIFRSVKGMEERENNSPSYFNVLEVDVVQDYVSKLLNSKDNTLDQNEIGIISPYKKQVQKIRQRLLQRWSKITVASVEEFQGQERKVIIISTVRSRHELVATDYKHGLGFLKNEKRFNVAITRAMALLIVVGNPDILQCDPNWRKFLEYCSEHLALVGEPVNDTLPKDFNINI